MYRIADLNFGKSDRDCWYEYEYGGKLFEVQRFGANFSTAYLRDLIARLRNQVDAFAINGLPPVMKVREKRYVHRQYLEIMTTPSSVPLCDGWRVREIVTVNALSEAISRGDIIPENGIFFPLGVLHLEAIRYLGERYGSSILIGDAYSLMRAPVLMKPDSPLARFAPLMMNWITLRDVRKQTPIASGTISRLARSMLATQVQGVQYVVGDIGALLLFGEDLDFIRDKDVILTTSHPASEPVVKRFAPRSVTNLFPKEFQFSPFINYSVLDATLRLAEGRETPLSIEEWQQLLGKHTRINPETKRYVLGSRPSAQYRLTQGFNILRNRMKKAEAPDFAFVVHALSRDDLFRVPGLGALKEMPLSWRQGLERFASKAPGFTYGHISQIISKKNNREVSGVIYGLMSTPKMMREEDPEVTYRKIERLCDNAADLGAKIIGLGAYTKVVGDSGATINRNSPIPVTTGNSLSASATLWAVHETARQMNLIRTLEGTATSQGLPILDGTATVIGATGSIGRVSAKLLSMVMRRLCLVAPRLNRLEELATEIRKLAPHCEVLVTTDANSIAPQTDILVTATSAFDQKVVDVELLKPGCVVCDCSRPLDFSKEDAMARPDILIIESGEVVLPGPVKLSCDLGLPDDAVYACLGETAILAMEGLYEPFTLGREIDWLKVKKIYRLANEHGVKLAAIRGHAGLITPREIELARSLALSKLGDRRKKPT